jgi:membrane protein
VLLITPVLLYPLLLTVPVMAALTIPLAWGFRIVGSARVRWTALAGGALLTAACLSLFLQGFVLFLSLPLELGAPFGGLTVVGGVVALGFWLFLLHVVVLAGWLFTPALHERLGQRATPAGRPG